MNVGPDNCLLGNWYRSPSSDHDGFVGLQNDLHRFLPDVTGIILSGDMNVHHQRWLYHSNGDTLVGTDLKVLCDSLGLLQLVRAPTRYHYLHDLFTTDVPGCAT